MCPTVNGAGREPKSDANDHLPRATKELRKKLKEDDGNLTWRNLWEYPYKFPLTRISLSPKLSFSFSELSFSEENSGTLNYKDEDSKSDARLSCCTSIKGPSYSTASGRVKGIEGSLPVKGFLFSAISRREKKYSKFSTYERNMVLYRFELVEEIL
ncbi:hypothetical protein M5K25_026663 [Dendrobium thyrsiflorum]|uniref:Uncharacterized protein n=1 Tax=Dendrobium thyrsiflorum TaxID=117978 RepID=A0ABD0TY80_DENTH